MEKSGVGGGLQQIVRGYRDPQGDREPPVCARLDSDPCSRVTRFSTKNALQYARSGAFFLPPLLSRLLSEPSLER